MEKEAEMEMRLAIVPRRFLDGAAGVRVREAQPRQQQKWNQG
jgi:hypothetical protein